MVEDVEVQYHYFDQAKHVDGEIKVGQCRVLFHFQ